MDLRDVIRDQFAYKEHLTQRATARGSAGLVRKQVDHLQDRVAERQAVLARLQAELTSKEAELADVKLELQNLYRQYKASEPPHDAQGLWGWLKSFV